MALSRELPGGSSWSDIFPEGMPKIIMSSQTMDVLKKHSLVSPQASTSQSPALTMKPCAGKLDLQSWIFVSSYGRHGQPLDRHGRPAWPQMLIDWTDAMSGLPQAAAVRFVRIIVIRPDEAEQEVIWTHPQSPTSDFGKEIPACLWLMSLELCSRWLTSTA